jgi:hypothetical protein
VNGERDFLVDVPSGYRRLMRRLRGALTIAFFAAVVVLIVAIMFGLLPLVTPDGIARKIAHNGEGVVLLLIVTAWIQFVRPRLAESSLQGPVTLGVAAASLALGLLLILTDPINQLRTLNETFIAAGVLIPYVQLPRPVPRALPLGVSGGLLLLVVVASADPTVTLMAEMLGALILTPLGLDVIDRGILDPNATTVPAVRYSWYAFLVIAPFVFWATHNGETLSGWLVGVLSYAGRTTEAFLYLLVLELYFAVGHGRTGSASSLARPRELVAR